MALPEIVRLVERDIPFGKRLTDIEGWHRSEADWRRLVAVEPHGVFKATVGGKDAGVGGVVTYGEVAWVHSIIVAPEMRGSGVGRAIMERCLEYAERSGARTVKLDAVKGFEPFYESFGFKREFESCRFVSDPRRGIVQAERMRSRDLSEVAALDRRLTGLDRSRVLEAIFKDAPELAFVKRIEKNVCAFVLGRRGQPRNHVGPLVSAGSNIEHAKEVLTTFMAQDRTKGVRICVPGNNDRAIELMSSISLKKGTSSTRMYRGEVFEESRDTFGMISPEKG